MILLLKLLAAHFIGDFLLQPKSWIQDKQKKGIKSLKLYIHLLVHAAALIIFLIRSSDLIPILLITIGSHYIIDLWKIYNITSSNRRKLFFIDQALHILVAVILAQVYAPFLQKLDIQYEKILLIGVCFLFVTVVSAQIIKELISHWSPETEDGERDSLSNAGYYIGILERLFIFGFILLNHWQAIGFLLAAKSVFRFGDLKESGERKLTEYILIGTLLSFGFGIITGIFYKYLLLNIMN